MEGAVPAPKFDTWAEDGGEGAAKKDADEVERSPTHRIDVSTNGLDRLDIGPRCPERLVRDSEQRDDEYSEQGSSDPPRQLIRQNLHAASLHFAGVITTVLVLLAL